MKTKNNYKKILPNQHLEYYVKNTTALERLNWLEEARRFVVHSKEKRNALQHARRKDG